ncbi:primosomal protein N', partial [Mesorhizobium sp. M00.F.Ca.ET.186.01.1.1]
QLPLAEVEKQFPEEYLLVPGWISSGLLATEYQVTDRITRKQQSFVRSLLDASGLEEAIRSLPARAEQMRRALELFRMHEGQSFS